VDGSYENLKLEVADRCAVVTLDRPASRNALSHRLMRELIAVAHELAGRDDVDAVILSGGPKCFSAGADLEDARAWADPSLSISERRRITATGYRLCRAWEEIPQITIAAIEGYAVGGGLALALACDWRVAGNDAFVSLPEISLGIPLTWGTIPRLVNLLGPAKAKRLTILCERIAAPQALALGLLEETVPAGEALARARDMAGRALAMPPAVVRMSKESINAVATALNHAAGYMAHDQIALAAASEESRAAREAALHRRK
jgi:enoyl-CoA hydratase/carnithine racemase